ncbi:MAG: nuclear transport factor 2 family protein [Pseudomonadota bacterium]
MTSASGNEAHLERYYAALKSGDPARMAAAVTDDLLIIYHDATDVLPWSGTWRGADGLRGFLDAVAKNLTIDQVDMLSSSFVDDKAIVHLRGTWTATRTGRSLTAEVVNIFTFRDSLVAGYEVFPDSAAFGIALGVLLAEPS